ncbi:MAG: hypothetical protein K940chlam9_00345 [Chlamydiae bacterium]|nr:hypothetical protein [Chlamydiota bacterium]
MEETVELVPIHVEKVLQSRSYTCIVLDGEEKKFAIYCDVPSGKAMNLYLSSTEKPRPGTHDLMNRIFMGLNIKLKHVVVYDVEETIYYARIFFEQQIGEILHIVEIDSRPSDGITLALMHKVPIYSTRRVLDKTIPYED